MGGKVLLVIDLNKSIKLLLLVQLALLVRPDNGFGQRPLDSSLESYVAAAQKAQAAQDYIGAAKAYGQAVRIEPNMPELWANFGLMQRQAGNASGAMVSFRHANRINPSLYVPNLFLGIDYLRDGKTALAITFLTKAVKTNKTDPQAPLALGRAYFAAKKFSAAAQELDRAVALDPKLGSAWFTLGIALLDQVEVDARRMSAEGKQSPFAGALYAESLHKQGRFGEAVTLYKSLLESRPQPPCLRSELGFSLLREHDEPAADVEFAAERAAHPECGLALLGQARLAIDAGENARAAMLINELWNRDHGFVASNATILLEGLPSEKASAATAFFFDPDNSLFASDLRGALSAAFNLSSQDSDSPAIGEDAKSRLASEPVGADGRNAEQLYTAGQFQQCARRLGSSPTGLNAGKLQLLAACSIFSGDNLRAAGAASALESLQPHSLEALYWSIEANERLALNALARFQRLEPDSARSHVLLGDIYHQLERYDAAEAEYRDALALAPNNPAALLGLASTRLVNNNIEGAKDAAQLALIRSPEDPELNLIMAEVMLSHHDYPAAEPYLHKSLGAKPQMLPRVHALIGKVYAETGRTQEAIYQLKLGASSDEDGSIQYLLSRLYRTLGDSKHAAEALDRMKVIKQQRRDRGVKRVEDPELSAIDSSPTDTSTP